MRRSRRIVLALTAVALMWCVAGVSVPAAQAPQAPDPVRGELVAVDTEAKSITVRIAENETVRFQYTEELKVTGAQETVAGLATAKDVRVTVHFTEKEDMKIATEIEVQPAP